MKNSTLEALAVSIAALDGQRATLANLIGERHDARLLIEGNITAAVSARDAATAALDAALVLDALGEPADLDGARAALATASKALATASKNEGAARELAGIEHGLMARLAPLEQTLSELRAEHAAAVAEAKFTTLEAELHQGIKEYTAFATGAMAALARSVARHQYLVEAGRAPGLMNAGISATACGSFNGYPVQGNVDDMLRAERQRINAAMRLPL